MRSLECLTLSSSSGELSSQSDCQPRKLARHGRLKPKRRTRLTSATCITVREREVAKRVRERDEMRGDRGVSARTAEPQSGFYVGGVVGRISLVVLSDAEDLGLLAGDRDRADLGEDVLGGGVKALGGSANVADRARDRGGLGCLGQHGDTAGTDDAAPWGACKGQRR